MAATYNNQIEIVLFANNKRKSDKAPHETGTVTFPDGTKYDVAVWNRVSKNGNPFKSGTLKLPDPRFAEKQGGGYAPRDERPAGEANVDW
jgi:uncharacterized protein (DUF736 family)